MHVWRVELPSNRAHLSSDERSQFQMLLPAEKNKKFVFLVLLFIFRWTFLVFRLSQNGDLAKKIDALIKCADIYVEYEKYL